MTVEQLSSIAGVVLSLAFTYIPGLAKWYEPLPREQKQLVMLASLVVVSGAIFGMACLNLSIGFDVVCTSASAWELVKVIFAALIANQATYLISRK